MDEDVGHSQKAILLKAAHFEPASELAEGIEAFSYQDLFHELEPCIPHFQAVNTQMTNFSCQLLIQQAMRYVGSKYLGRSESIMK